MKRFKFLPVCFFLLNGISILTSQEALKSAEEEYFDFLSLQGIVKRPTLGFRTLSDSEWKFQDEEILVENEDGTFSKIFQGGEASEKNVWAKNNLGSKWTLWESKSQNTNWFLQGIDRSVKLKVYGPEWYNSYNTASPYGQNDGALWQGKGYNTSLTGGARLEALGFEVTLKPQISFSQNAEFEYIKPNYSGENYAGKADTYGYYGVASVDAPQRFGNTPFFTFDWGDTEIRWSWHTFTVGFGTQAPWIGPAWLNPIIHSNNAASYPKVDIGIRKTPINLPGLGWYIGDIEARIWWGKLTESDYFDTDETNDNSIISGFSLYYQLPFLKEFTIGINRTMLSKWNNLSPYTTLFFIPGISNLTSGGGDESDQRFSITFDYLNTHVGWEVYFEWARNDFSPNLDYILRYPFHTQGWTFGTKKSVVLPWNLRGEIILEITGLECSADYDRLLSWYSTFYAHHEVTQGYTNRGQWLGAGIGTGGNSQYLGFKVYYPKGYITLFGQRRNPDLDYTMYIDSRKEKTDSAEVSWIAEASIRAMIDFGIEAKYFATDSLQLGGKFVFQDEHNPLNDNSNLSSVHRLNFIFNLSVKYVF